VDYSELLARRNLQDSFTRLTALGNLDLLSRETREQKKINRLRSATRIEIEHTFSRRKKYGIAAEV